MKIAIIGTGNLGSAIAKGLITNNAITTLQLTKRNVGGLADFEGYQNVFLTADNKEAVQKSDIIILAVQPAHLENILNEINLFLTEKTGFKTRQMIKHSYYNYILENLIINRI